jgi:hypothetical protein
LCTEDLKVHHFAAVIYSDFCSREELVAIIIPGAKGGNWWGTPAAVVAVDAAVGWP